MYIKIKHIKFTALVFACFLFTLINYLNFANADDVTSDYSSLAMPSSQPKKAASTLTDEFTQNLNDFISNKGEQTISTTDLQNLSSEFIAQKTAPITLDSLPLIDETKIKVLKQPYSSLSETDRKNKLQADANTYIEKIIYLIISNSPTPITNKDDAKAFGQNFMSHLNSYSVSATNDDVAYFNNLASKVDQFMMQVNDIEVPETLLQNHIKFLRLVKGVLNLRNELSPSEDPMAGMIIFSKVQGYAKLFSDFFKNEFADYANQISN